ncbi:MAG: hypothetical protein ACJAVD_000948 [Porticoccaceae bacterium]|jgi:hypothetical protein
MYLPVLFFYKIVLCLLKEIYDWLVFFNNKTQL